jgi:hypothetical protein
MTRPDDLEIWNGFERRLSLVESLVPNHAPRWTGPAEQPTDADLRIVPATGRTLRMRDASDRRLVLIAASVLALIGAFRLMAGAPSPEPAGQPTTVPSRTTGPSASPAASSSAIPVPSFRPIDGVVFKEVPEWLVPADGSAGPSSFSEDGTWTQHFDIPRLPADVVDDYRNRLTSRGVNVETTTQGSQVRLRTRGAVPSIVVTVNPNGTGSGVDLSFDRRGS